MAGVNYVRVCEEEDDNPIEIPIEADGTVLLTTLNGVFPKATGLKYLAEDSDCYRGVRLSDGKLFSPQEGWVHVYSCAFPKSDKKRKVEEDEDLQTTKSKKLEGKKCTDLIVLNLAWKTDESSLKEYFSRYGELVMVQVKRHPATQHSKGYGFIRFAEYESQAMCLAERHYIDSRWCDVRVPMSKVEGDKQEVGRKVHVGGIADTTTPETLMEYFGQFGRVLDVFIPKPPRSFAFVTFEDPEVAASLLGKQQKIDGWPVTIGTAVPKLPPQNNRNGPMQNPMHLSMAANPWGWSAPGWPFRPQECEVRGYDQSMGGPVPMHRMNMMNPGHPAAQFQQHYNRHYPVPGNRAHM